MKICICGKGGCGKSTVVSLLAYSFKQQGKKVFVLDSDESNNNLYWMPGFDQPPCPGGVRLPDGERNQAICKEHCSAKR